MIAVAILIVLILFFAGVIPGLYLNRDPLTEIVTTTSVYEGDFDYTIEVGLGFWARYTTSSGVRTYTIEYDSGDESQSMKTDMNTYTKGVWLLEDSALLATAEEVKITTHGGAEVGTFTISTNEAI